MALTFNESSVAKRMIGAGVTRQRLLTTALVNNTGALLDRFALTAGASVEFEVSAKSVAWLQVLEGETTLKTLYSDQMPKNHSAFLQPGYHATLSAGTDASVLYVEIPDAKRLDPGFSSVPPIFNLLDWTREPVFESQSDGRKRMALVNPEMCH